MRRVLATIAAYADVVELRDLTFLAGLALAAWGGARISGPWTAIVVGGLLVLLSLPRRAS